MAEAMLMVAVPAALAGAASIGLATAAQQQAAAHAGVGDGLGPRALAGLLRRPLWLLGLVATVAGLGLQLLALSCAPITLIQPMLVTGLLFGVAFSAVLSRQRPDRVLVWGALGCAVGLAAFLALARPHAAGAAGAGPSLASSLICAGVVAAALGWAAAARRAAKVLVLALGTGVLYGLTASLLKVLGDELRGGWTEPLGHPTLYVVGLLGPAAFLLSQYTLAQGRLLAPAMSVIITVDPLVGMVLGAVWFGERIVTSPGALAGELVSALVVIAGIATVTARAARLRTHPGGPGHDLGPDNRLALSRTAPPRQQPPPTPSRPARLWWSRPPRRGTGPGRGPRGSPTAEPRPGHLPPENDQQAAAATSPRGVVRGNERRTTTWHRSDPRGPGASRSLEATPPAAPATGSGRCCPPGTGVPPVR